MPSDTSGDPLAVGSKLIAKQHLLLPSLLEEQQCSGWISEQAAEDIGRRLGVPLSEVFGVVEFYSLLTTEPTGETVIHVCDGPVCRMQGSERALAAVAAGLHLDAGELDPAGRFSLERAPCLGQCDGAPAALVGSRPVWQLGEDSSSAWVVGTLESPPAAAGGQPRRKSARCGEIDPTDLDQYLGAGGYQGLVAAVQSMSPEEVVEVVKESKLVGRGGAAFPTGLKWQYTATGSEPRYVVCNGDESEPGTFKDRVLMEGDPFAVLEGMAIAGYATGAEKGFLYVRGEYPRAQRILMEAIETARQGGYLGERILDTTFSFEIELRSGAGAYICGEETALFESIEGRRGHPRIKPPFPTVHGLFGQPTVINNVETLCDVAWIMANGAKAHLAAGTEDSAGTRLFCLSADVANPGVYEYPYGVPLEELLAAAGGVSGELQTVLLGGAAGTFLRPDQLDLELSMEATRAAGHSIGSGAVMVFNQDRSLSSILLSLAGFFAHESCGKCLPCQLGTQRQLELVQRSANGGLRAEEEQMLRDVIHAMTHSSLCGLGATAGLAVGSALERWPGIFSGEGERDASS